MIEATIAYLILVLLSYILVLPIVKDRIYRRYLPKHEGGRYLMLVSSHVMTVFFLLILYPSTAVGIWLVAERLGPARLEHPPLDSSLYNVLIFLLLAPLIQAFTDHAIISTTEVSGAGASVRTYLKVCFVSGGILISILFLTPFVLRAVFL